MNKTFLSLSIKIAYFLVGFYGFAFVYLLMNELFSKAFFSLLLAIVFGSTILINKATIISKENFLKLKKIIKYIKNIESDDNKIKLILFCLDVEYFKKNRKTFTGFFWIKKETRPYSSFVDSALLTYKETNEELAESDKSFLIDHQNLFSLSTIELNSKIQENDSFSKANNNSLIMSFS